MKRKKSIFKLLAIILLLGVITTGCFKRDDMEDISIITTVYPLEYVVNQLYGNNSVVNSIYPDGVDIDEYKITSKEYKDFSKKDLFVYNGLSSDKDIALKLINKNKNIMIMDANFGMEIQYGIEELWLNPSNLLMISQNIKNSLDELIDSKYIKEEIEEAIVTPSLVIKGAKSLVSNKILFPDGPKVLETVSQRSSKASFIFIFNSSGPRILFIAYPPFQPCTANISLAYYLFDTFYFLFP